MSEYFSEFGNKADVKVGLSKLFEFKSWTPGGQAWNNFFKGSSLNQQFARYLFRTDDINDLKYVFNANKASEAQVKDAFKALLTNRATEVYNAMSPGLRVQFGLDDASDLTPSIINEIVNTMVKVR